MSIYDRDYMKFSQRSQQGGFMSETPAAKYLLIANVAIFFLSVFFPKIYDVFSLSVETFKSGMIWRLFTYAFLHGDILHILCNMLGIFFVGAALEKWIGARRFLFVYFSGVVVGAIAWLAFSWTSSAELVGASAGVLAVMATFCAMYPPIPLTLLLFFIIPIRLMPMTALKLTVAFEVFGLLYSLSGGNSDIAYSGHLGGLAIGYVLAKAFQQGKLAFIQNIKLPKISIFKNKTKRGVNNYKYKVNISPENENVNEKIDIILNKINREGFASLTEEEREFLRSARPKK